MPIGVTAALLALALTLAPLAVARGGASRPFASLPHLGPAPHRCELGTDPNCPEFTQGTNYTVESSCGAINISPHVVNVGQNVTATVVETARQCRIQWGSPPDKLVAGCKDGVYKVINPQKVETIVPPSPTCVWKATQASAYPPDAKAPGGGWDQFEVGFCAFVGCAALASDFFYVLPHKKAISGTVYSNNLDAVGNRVGLANAVIRISGASSGTAVTNSNGFYDALVDPGRYTVHVASINGQSVSATPIACSPGSASGNDCKLDVGGRDGVADFSSCGASGPAGDIAGPAALAENAAAGGAGCQLKVFVKQLEPLRSGLAVHSPHFSDYPVDFIAPEPDVYKCQSGCSDLLVTVIDQTTHQAIPDATVTASVDPLMQNYVHGDPAIAGGDQFLCATTDGRDDRGCGTDLRGLTTDFLGQVHLRYYVPGLTSKVSTTLTVTAKEKCSGGGSCKLKKGASHTTLTAEPYLVYKHSVPLTAEEVDDLAAWAGGTRLFTKFLKAATAGPRVLTYALKYLVAAEVAAEDATKALELVEKAEPVVGVIELAKTFTELWERQSMIAMFLEKAGLRGIGPGDDPFEPSAPGRPALAFENKIVNYGVVLPFNAGANGFWWNVATTLRKLQAAHNLGGPWTIAVNIYEVSHCGDPGKDCGPGYGFSYGAADGIKPELYFHLYLLFHGRHNFAQDGDTFTIPYDAAIWAETQDNLLGVS